MPERMKAGAFRRSWIAAKEDVRLLKQNHLEGLSGAAKVDMLLDTLYEGVTGEEAPDIAEMAS